MSAESDELDELQGARRGALGRTDPAADLHAGVREALAELGIDACGAFPEPLTDEVVQAADVVVTMGCGDACPVLPGRRYLDWALPDPEGASPERMREIRDETAARVSLLLHELSLDRASP